ncbi:hypothetical protein BDR06DRAFT_789061 [Suillus hirtellus]|nr:hypothetical protein BDR06DRAFT_789061 [Suillus hirtellus]
MKSSKCIIACCFNIVRPGRHSKESGMSRVMSKLMASACRLSTLPPGYKDAGVEVVPCVLILIWKSKSTLITGGTVSPQIFITIMLILAIEAQR